MLCRGESTRERKGRVVNIALVEGQVESTDGFGGSCCISEVGLSLLSMSRLVGRRLQGIYEPTYSCC